MVTDQQLTYLPAQWLARIATVDVSGQPDVVPVVFEYDGTYFWALRYIARHPAKWGTLWRRGMGSADLAEDSATLFAMATGACPLSSRATGSARERVMVPEETRHEPPANTPQRLSAPREGQATRGEYMMTATPTRQMRAPVMS